MNSLSINKSNNDFIQEMIKKKQSSYPYYATVKDVKSTLTDMDQFPYTRWFRGVADVSVPIVAEREAGYRPRHDNCYNFNLNKAEIKSQSPPLIFEGPCSVVFPKFKEGNEKINDVVLNANRIVEYR